MQIKFNANHQKIIEALLWFAHRSKRTDIHSLVKELFYSDKIHLDLYGRPVTGDSYVKLSQGPVATVAYDFLKWDRLHSKFINKYDPEIFENAIQSLDTTDPFCIKPLRSPELDYFSGTDLECMESAFQICNGKSFDELVEMTHLEPAWFKAPDNGGINIVDFIDENKENRESFIDYIRESSECAAL